MSWLARSIANSLRLDEDEDGPENEDGAPFDAAPPEDLPRDSTHSAGVHRNYVVDGDIEGDDNRRGVKEDLSELKESLARQLWGVASFLAPPPPPPPPPPLIRMSGYEDRRGDQLVDHGLKAAGQFGPSEDYYINVVEEAIGITEEVLAFAKDIAHHPETWLDFPLSEEEEFDDFDISDAQYKHALAVEHQAPRLAALRIELCPIHMSEGYFWMVYFVLLHSRLSKHDADLLSSSQLTQARIMWMHELEKRTKEELEMSEEPLYSPHQSFIMHSDDDDNNDRFGNAFEPAMPVESFVHQMADAEHEIEKHSVSEIEFVDKSVIKEDLAPKLQEEMILSSITALNYDHGSDKDDDDDWLKDVSDFIGYSDKLVMGNEEDISFSDLEDDVDCTMPVKYEMPPSEWNTSTETSRV